MLTPEERRRISEFAKDKNAIRESAQAYARLSASGALDRPRSTSGKPSSPRTPPPSAVLTPTEKRRIKKLFKDKKAVREIAEAYTKLSVEGKLDD